MRFIELDWRRQPDRECLMQPSAPDILLSGALAQGVQNQ